MGRTNICKTQFLTPAKPREGREVPSTDALYTIIHICICLQFSVCGGKFSLFVNTNRLVMRLHFVITKEPVLEIILLKTHKHLKGFDEKFEGGSRSLNHQRRLYSGPACTGDNRFSCDITLT